jgi:hypothetical protein
MEDSSYRFFGNAYIGSERFLLRFRVPLAALLALVPLNLISALTGLHRFDSATVARLQISFEIGMAEALELKTRVASAVRITALIEMGVSIGAFSLWD